MFIFCAITSDLTCVNLAGANRVYGVDENVLAFAILYLCTPCSIGIAKLTNSMSGWLSMMVLPPQCDWPSKYISTFRPTSR